MPKVTATVALGEIELDPADRRKVDRYVDVTKAALFFARAVVLVEGISEALLVPVIGKKVVFVADDAVEKRNRIGAATIVAVGSVDFEPYIRLLLTKVNGHAAADKVIVITDSDPNKEGELAARIARLDDLVTEFGSSLKVCKAPNTLEAEWISAGNEVVMHELYLSVHPQSEAKWQAAVVGSDSVQRATNFYQALRSREIDLPKGEFSQLLAERIEAGTSLTCPDYLEDALNEIVAE